MSLYMKSQFLQQIGRENGKTRFLVLYTYQFFNYKIDLKYFQSLIELHLCLPLCLGQKTAKGRVGLRVKLPPVSHKR